jgi:hypothetical protein
MPEYVRHDSVRRLEASIESLVVAMTSLAALLRVQFREPTSRYAAAVVSTNR